MAKLEHAYGGRRELRGGRRAKTAHDPGMRFLPEDLRERVRVEEDHDSASALPGDTWDVSFARLHDRIHRLEEWIVVIEPAVDVCQMRALALLKGDETGDRLTS